MSRSIMSILNERHWIYCTLLLLVVHGFGITVEERSYLMDLFAATNGEYWKNHTNWGRGEPCLMNWYGVECTNNYITFLFVFFSINYKIFETIKFIFYFNFWVKITKK